MKRPTIISLQTELAEQKKLASDNYDSGRKWKELADAREKEVKQVRDQFADLKKRLHDSEVEVARLNGYVARVREDDVVREELIAVGDPEGEQRMVPKRKPEYLGNHDSSISPMDSIRGYDSYGNPKPKPKHWIEY